MLYPLTTPSRTVLDLSGLWKFMIDEEITPIDPKQPLPTEDVIRFRLPSMIKPRQRRFVSTTALCGTKLILILPNHCAASG